MRSPLCSARSSAVPSWSSASGSRRKSSRAASSASRRCSSAARAASPAPARTGVADAHRIQFEQLVEQGRRPTPRFRVHCAQALTGCRRVREQEQRACASRAARCAPSVLQLGDLGLAQAGEVVESTSARGAVQRLQLAQACRIEQVLVAAQRTGDLSSSAPVPVAAALARSRWRVCRSDAQHRRGD